MSKPETANRAGPFLKPIPFDSKRYDSNTSLNKMFSFINKKITSTGLAILMGYNVKGWDEPVLRENCARFSVMPSWDRLKFFDIAEVAHHLGFPMGTTQQQLETALDVKKLPANRHRAHADVRVVKQIWQKMTNQIKENQEALNRINRALLNENAELEVSKILAEYDPSLIASEETTKTILATKEEEKAPRKEIMILFDTETTGLLPKQRSHHDLAIRIIELGAKILSPYSGREYNETFSTFVNPGVPIPAEATAIHGIRNEDLTGKPNMKECLESFDLWIRTSNTYRRMITENETPLDQLPRIVLVGYNNAHYDNALLIEEGLLARVDLKRQLDKQVKKSYDTMMLMSTWYTGESSKPPSNKLQDHARFLDIPEQDAHRALGDVETLEAVLKTICAPINPVLIISEALNFPGEPGKSAKAIIKGALSLISTQSHEDAVKKAAQNYKDSLTSSSSSSIKAPASRKRKISAITPQSQSFLVNSQDSSQQVLYT